jgi:ribosomal protein S3
MGQKINTIGFRLGKRVNWPSSWCETTNSYADVLFSDLEIRFFNKKLISYLGFYVNNVIIRKSTKGLKLYTKLISSKNILAARKQRKKNLQYKILSPFNSYFTLDYYKSLGGFLSSARAKKKVFKTSKKNNILPLFSAQTLSDYIAEQLIITPRLKHWSFKLNVQSGIAQIASKLFKGDNIALISGLKVTCKGKWRKTKSGRKQKIAFSIGSLQSQTMVCLSSYGFTTSATKFGAFGIKVWICYKPFKRKRKQSRL